MCRYILLNIARVLIVSAFITSLPAYGGDKDGCGGGVGELHVSCKTGNGIPATSGIPPTSTAVIIKVNIDPKFGAESSPLAVKIASYEPPTDWSLVLPTWLLAIFTFTLWQATRQMVKETMKSSQNVQRAFVFIKNIDVMVIPHQIKTIIIPVWENSGDTPTKKMRNYVNWQYFPTDIPQHFDFPDHFGEESTAMIIGPHATIPASPLEIENIYIDNILAGQGHLYIWGWAEYNDVFDKTIRHRTEFCNEVLISKMADNKVNFRFRLYRLHNGADGDCFKKLIT